MGRVFGFLSIVIVLGIACTFIPSRSESSAPAGANNPKAAINITGVKSDLIILHVRAAGTSLPKGKYASFDELISSNYITVARQRPPYTYEIETTAAAFARSLPAPVTMPPARPRRFQSTRIWISNVAIMLAPLPSVRLTQP